MEIFMTASLNGIDPFSQRSSDLTAFTSLPGSFIKLKKCFKNWIDHLEEAKEEDLFGNKSDKF